MREQDTPPLGAAAGLPSEDSERELDVSAIEFLSAEDLELMAEADVTPPRSLAAAASPASAHGAAGIRDPGAGHLHARPVWVLVAAFVVQLLRHKWIVGFVGANTATTHERNRMLIWIAAGAGAGILLALALWAWGRPRRAPRA